MQQKYTWQHSYQFLKRRKVMLVGWLRSSSDRGQVAQGDPSSYRLTALSCSDDNLGVPVRGWQPQHDLVPHQTHQLSTFTNKVAGLGDPEDSLGG